MKLALTKKSLTITLIISLLSTMLFIQVKNVHAAVNTAPTAPTITRPTASQSLGGPDTITWTASTDTEQSASQLKYEISISENDGSSWTIINPLTSSGATSFLFNFSNQNTVSTMKLRIRAYDGFTYGPYATSGTFTNAKRYIYSKYNVNKTYIDNSPWTYWYDQGGTVTYKQNYTFDNLTNSYSTSGPDVTVGGNGNIAYQYVSPAQIIRYNGKVGGGYSIYSKANTTNTFNTSRGSLIESNIIAPNSYYPSSGAHTDGFWYERGSNYQGDITFYSSNSADKIVNTNTTISFPIYVYDPLSRKVDVVATLGGVTRTFTLAVGVTAANGTLTWNLAVDNIPDGVYTGFTFNATTSDGLVFPATHKGRVIIDRSPPNISLSVSDGSEYTESVTPAIVVTDGVTNTTVDVKLDGTAYTIGTPITTLGDHTIVITATDQGGNISTKSANFRVTALPTNSSGIPLTISSGLLSINQTPITFNSVVVDLNSPMISTASTKLNISDSRGSGSGWSVMVSGSDFISSTLIDPSSPSAQITTKFPISAVSLSVSALTVKGGQPIDATNGPTTSNLTLSNIPQSLINVKPGFGMGVYDANLNLSLNVPGNVSINSLLGTGSKYLVGGQIGFMAGMYVTTLVFTTAAGI